MAILRSLIVSLQARTEHFEQGMRKATRDLEKFRQQTTMTQATFTALQRSVTGLAAGFLSFQVLQRVGSQIVQAGIAAERTTAAFRAIAGSALAGRQEMSFVAETATRLGVDLTSLEGAYQRLLAASRGTTLEGQKSRDIFTAIAEAGTVLQLSSEQVEGALNAVQQMISKGTVSSEELRGQLGERLPGAFQIAARAIGVSTEALSKMLEQGQVMTDTFLPRFAAQIRRELGGAVEDSSQTAAANLARVGNAVTILARNLASSGLIQWVTGLAAAWANVFTRADAALKKQQEIAAQQTQAQLTAAGGLTLGTQAQKEMADVEQQMARIRKEVESLQRQLAENLPAVLRSRLEPALEQLRQQLVALEERRQAIIRGEQTTQAGRLRLGDVDITEAGSAQIQAMVEQTQRAVQRAKDLTDGLRAIQREAQEVRNTTKAWESDLERVRAEQAVIEKGLNDLFKKFGKPTEGGGLDLGFAPGSSELAMMQALVARAKELQDIQDQVTQGKKEQRAEERDEERERKEALQDVLETGREQLRLIEQQQQFLQDLDDEYNRLTMSARELLEVEIQRQGLSEPLADLARAKQERIEQAHIQETLTQQARDRFETEEALVDEIFREVQALMLSNEQLQNQALLNARVSQATWDFVEALRQLKQEQLTESVILDMRTRQGEEIEQLVDGLRAERDGLRYSNAELARRVLLQNQAGEGTKRLVESLQQEIEVLAASREIADTVTDALIDMAATGELSLKNLQQTFSRMVLEMLADAIHLRQGLSNLVAKGLELAVNALPGGAGGGTASATEAGAAVQGFRAAGYGGGLQHGGAVVPGRFYTVGESGPELLVAGASGTVIPGGARPVVINMNVRTLDADSFRRSGDQIAAQMVTAAQKARRVI